MIPYFGQEINSGLQAGNAATEKALFNLGSGISTAILEANRAYKQRKYNSELERLQAERAEIPGLGISEEDTKARLEQNDRQLRDLDVVGYARGVRTALTPENYLQNEQHKADMAQRKEENEAQLKQRMAEMDFKLKEEEKNGILQEYKDAMAQHRMMLGNKTTIAASGQTDNFTQKLLEDLQEQADMYSSKAGKLKEHGMKILGLPEHHFYESPDATNVTNKEKPPIFSNITGKEAAQLALKIGKNYERLPNKPTVIAALYDMGLNPADASSDLVYKNIENIFATNEAEKERQYKAKTRTMDLEEKNLSAIASKRKEEAAANEASALAEFKSRPNVWTPTPENKAALASYVKDYKEDEKFKTGNLGTMAASAIANFMNKDMSDAEYNVALGKLMGTYQQPPAAPASAMPGEPPKKRRVGDR